MEKYIGAEGQVGRTTEGNVYGEKVKEKMQGNRRGKSAEK